MRKNIQFWLIYYPLLYIHDHDYIIHDYNHAIITTTFICNIFIRSKSHLKHIFFNFNLYPINLSPDT